jgi:hypothetical protein
MQHCVLGMIWVLIKTGTLQAAGRRWITCLDENICSIALPSEAQHFTIFRTIILLRWISLITLSDEVQCYCLNGQVKLQNEVQYNCLISPEPLTLPRKAQRGTAWRIDEAVGSIDLHAKKKQRNIMMWDGSPYLRWEIRDGNRPRWIHTCRHPRPCPMQLHAPSSMFRL